MSPREKPEKRKPAKPQPDDQTGAGNSTGLERRLHAAGSQKSARGTRIVSASELLETAHSKSHKFTLAKLEIAEFKHIELTKGTREAKDLTFAIEKEIASQLRQDDLIARADDGRYLVYLPETGKTEATMVLERLTRLISTRNNKRIVAPQLSLSYEICTERLVDEKTFLQAGNLNERRLHDWLSRYRIAEPFLDDLSASFTTGKDKWKDSQAVLIKRFHQPPDSFSSSDDAQNRDAILSKTLSTLQESGIPLMSPIIDFQFSGNHLYMVTEPVAAAHFGSKTPAEHIHRLAISCIDMMLSLAALSPPVAPPLLALTAIKELSSSHEFVIDGLDSYVIEALWRKSHSDQDAQLDSMNSLRNLLCDLFKNLNDDECLKEVLQHIDGSIAQKKFHSGLNKSKAVLKRHEERLRRVLPGTGEGRR